MNIPTHLGFIADGNRRWAKQQGLSALEGHQIGLKTIETTASECFARGVQFVSFYTFSSENWNRSKEEVSHLMSLASAQIPILAKKLAKNSIKLAVLGRRDRISPSLLNSIDKAERLTASGTKGTLAICFNYDGRAEIADAVSAISGDTTPEKISEHLYHPEIPDLDLVVRTSGEQRISGFMLWRASYAEFLFLKKYWPEITPQDVDNILKEYAARHRRFGK